MNRVLILVFASLQFSCANNPAAPKAIDDPPAMIDVKTRAVLDGEKKRDPKARAYFRHVNSLVAKSAAYPQESEAAGEQGTCRIRLMIRRDGLLINVVIVESSGFAGLDAACLQAGREPEFPAAPNSFDAEITEFLVELPITFVLPQAQS